MEKNREERSIKVGRVKKKEVKRVEKERNTGGQRG